MSATVATPSQQALSDAALRTIRATLLPDEASDFDREFRLATVEAPATLAVTGVLALVQRWQQVMWSSRGRLAHCRRMLERADRLAAADVATRPWRLTPAPVFHGAASIGCTRRSDDVLLMARRIDDFDRHPCRRRPTRDNQLLDDLHVIDLNPTPPPTLVDPTTARRVKLESYLPPRRYQRLLHTDLSVFARDPLGYDRSRHKLRSKLDEWERRAQSFDERSLDHPQRT